MKVLLKTNIERLGQIGDVVDVKSGYARNYLLPQGLATKPTEVNIKAVEIEKQEHLKELAKVREEIEARATVVRGKEITIPARANEEGHLYGSVGPAQIVAVLAAEGIFVDPENVVLEEPIRRLDKYDVDLRFAADVTATIHVWVVPTREIEGEQPGQDEPGAEDAYAPPEPDQADATDAEADESDESDEKTDQDARE